MSAIKTRVEYTLTLTHDEFRLVCLALGGLIKGPGSRDFLAAAELNIKLLEQKRRYLEELLEVNDGAIDRAREALGQATAELVRTEESVK
jgi:hypothetical protein